ncbi:PHP domain-containing protein [Ligilactobacillus equi]|nr:PHP domain-containing protein [Ligilactobacillus equi]
MFTPIDVTSTFTLLESNLKISDYVARGKELGYRSLALSDEDNLYGALTFYQACQAAGIRPILGLKLNLNFVGSKENVLFIALNQAGYQNLLQLSSLKLTQTDRREALTWRELAPYLADLA